MPLNTKLYYYLSMMLKPTTYTNSALLQKSIKLYSGIKCTK